MKPLRSLPLLLLVSLVGLTTSAQNLPPYVAVNGLVGWWPFNGNANDESGNGNDGTVNGPSLAGDRFGNSNSAYDFNANGGTEMILIPNSSSLSITGNMSFSLWMRTSVPIPNATWLSKYDGPNPFNGFSAGLNNGDGYKARWDIGDGTINQYGTTYRSAIGDTVVDADWHHVVGVYSGHDMYLYVDGVLSDTSYNSQNGVGPNTQDLLIGMDPWFGSRYYSGLLDDIGIWNRALTQQEINNLYQSSVPTPCAGANLPANLSQGLVGWWPFCGNANDESGSGNDGTVNGPISGPDRFGNPGTAYHFDGVDDYINIGNPLGTDSTDFSVSLWAKRALSGGGIAVAKMPGGNWANGKWMIDIYSNDLNYCLPNPNLQGCTTFSNNIGSDSLWHQVVLVHSLANDKLYWDGILVSSTASGLVVQAAADVWIGGRQNSLNYPFSGMLDDIGIWNRALSPQEITQLYNAGICYQTITVTDTLIINANLTGLNPVAFQNTIKVYPNPANDHITIDCGSNFNTMNGYSLRIDNSLGQTVYSTSINQQSFYVDLNTWSGNGVYFVYLINNNSQILEIRKIVIQ